MTAAELLIDIFQWKYIWYVTPKHHDAASRRMDALVLRRIKERLGR